MRVHSNYFSNKLFHFWLLFLVSNVNLEGNVKNEVETTTPIVTKTTSRPRIIETRTPGTKKILRKYFLMM